MPTDYRAALEAVTTARTLDEAVTAAARALEARPRTVSYGDYLRLVGLLALAADYRNMLTSIEHAACAITGDEPGGGERTSDAVWGEGGSAERLLERLGIVVEAAPDGPDDADGFAL